MHDCLHCEIMGAIDRWGDAHPNGYGLNAGHTLEAVASVLADLISMLQPEDHAQAIEDITAGLPELVERACAAHPEVVGSSFRVSSEELN